MSNSKNLNIVEYASNYPKKDYSEKDEADFLEYVYKHLREFESSVEHLYLDTKYKVTIGVGHHVVQERASASLNLIYKVVVGSPPTLQEPTADEKKAAWRTVAGLEPTIRNDIAGDKKFPSANNKIFKEATNLKLTEQSIKKLFENDLFTHLSEVRRIFHRFDKYPDPAKLAIIDLYYNVGGKVFLEFKNFKKCVIDEDWHCAGKESRRKTPHVERINKAQELFNRAADIKRAIDNGDMKLGTVLEGPLYAENSFNDVWEA